MAPQPRVYTIEYKRAMGARKVPFRRYHLRIWAPAQQVIWGEGNSWAERLQGRSWLPCSTPVGLGAGSPVWQTSNAYLRSSHSGRSPGPDYVGIPLLSGRDTTDTAPADKKKEPRGSPGLRTQPD